MLETNGYVVLEGYDLSPEELDAAQRWDVPALRTLAGLDPDDTAAPAYSVMQHGWPA